MLNFIIIIGYQDKGKHETNLYSIKEFKIVIEQAWNKLFPEFMQNLVILFEKCIFEVIKNDRNTVKY